MAADPIFQAVTLLQTGELVGMPTETVYGLAADAHNPDALRKIFLAKGRPSDHPLIVHIAKFEDLSQWAREIPAAAKQLADAFWPGPLTLVLKRSPSVSDLITGGQDTVAVRIPDHSLALRLLNEFGGALCAPSANRFGHISPTLPQHVIEELGNQVSLVLDGGACEMGIESTILDLTSDLPTILRPGVIGAAALESVLGSSIQTAPRHSSPRVSGSHNMHYAPRKALYRVSAAELTQRVIRNSECAVLAFQSAPKQFTGVSWIVASKSPIEYAHDLYANLRALDATNAAYILLETPPLETEWTAINDRLNRAATPATIS